MKRLELQIAGGTLSGRRFEVPKGGLRLGRSSSNDIHVPDEELSRNHCLFEISGEAGVRVTDLASANGTFVNGEALEGESRELKAGDTIEVGHTVVTVVGDSETPPPAAVVDLGLEGAKPGVRESGRRRSPLANVLWGVAAIVVAAAIVLILRAPAKAPTPATEPIRDAEPVVREVFYEKVEADLEGIFRYELDVSPEGTISVVLDDTRENRHPKIAPKRLDARAVAELNAILPLSALREFDREYVGAEPDPPAHASWRLKVVYDTAARSVRIVNAPEPEAFRTIREKLEAFTKNELGVNAIQYPRDKLIALAENSLSVARTRWEDREAQHGNVFAALSAYREALFYLETLDPKPDCAREAREGLDRATKELERRYADQRFLADRAINLGQWESAQRELAVLLELVPDRADARHREAKAKLVDVEGRLKGDK